MAFMAIQLAGDSAPNGARQAAWPRARPPPGPRWPRAAKVDSHTVRKHRTCRQRPEDTASMAATTAPPGPGQVAPAVDPGGVEAQGLFRPRSPRPRSSPCRPARGRSRGRRCRRGSRPASATALEAGVDGQRQRVDHEASTQGRAADPRQDGPVLEPVGAERGAGGEGARDRRPGSGRRAPRSARRGGARRRRAARSGPTPPGRCAPRWVRTPPRRW